MDEKIILKVRKVVKLFELPGVKEVDDLDDPATTLLHARIIRQKPLLRKLYQEFYHSFKNSLPSDYQKKNLVELGSGGGFVKEVIPNVVTSDVLKFPGIDRQFSALKMPFKNNFIDAFFMVDVFHHLPDIKKFLTEADRCLKIGGKIIIIDPANTPWARFIYKNFHHEVFDETAGWSFKKRGPLSSANSALAWIVFCRDRARFEGDFPSLKIKKLKFHTPLRYLLSGGFSLRQLLPASSYGIIKAVEFVFSPLNKYLGMFMTVELEKTA